MREAEVTVASPQRYWATMIQTVSAPATEAGRTPSTTDRNAPSPLAAVAPRSGAATTTAQSITQPASPEIQTERTIPLGTACAASRVSSAAWAGASKPVTV